MALIEDKLKQYAIFNNIPLESEGEILQSSTIEKPNPIVRNTKLVQTPKKEKNVINYVEADKVNNEDNIKLGIPNNPNNFVELSSGNGVIENSIRNLNVSKEDKNFLYKLAKRESSLNPNARTPSGTYRGLYQFSNKSLADIGLNMKKYSSDINTQHEAALKYGNLNLKRLSNYTKYIGSVINGIKITKEGIMAAAHLGGANNVKKFFDSNGKVDFKDGNNTPISEYFKLME